MHSSVLRFCTLEPYVPLRNATKRERLLFRSIGDIAAFVIDMAVNSNEYGEVTYTSYRALPQILLLCYNVNGIYIDKE